MKMLIALALMLTYCAVAKEEVPIFPLNSGIGVIYTKNEPNLINTDKMKRGKIINSINQEAMKNNENKIQLDVKLINQQRTLDYITKPNNYIFPPTF